MKLLFDQNISSALVGRLADLFPASIHVKNLGMVEADDEAIWKHAARNGFQGFGFSAAQLAFGRTAESSLAASR